MCRHNVVRRCAFLMVGLLLCLTAFSAQAIPTITFDQIINGGSLSYDGNGGPLVGSDILFDLIVGQGTPLHAGPQLGCQNCLLNFETGPNLTEPTLGNPLYTWDRGGFFSLTGAVKYHGIVIASGNLVEGKWLQPVVGLKGPGKMSVLGFGMDTKLDDFVDYFGLSLVDVVFNNSVLAQETAFKANGGFTMQIVEADLSNSAVAAVPEPDSLLILGGALAGLGWWTRRKYAYRRV